MRKNNHNAHEALMTLGLPMDPISSKMKAEIFGALKPLYQRAEEFHALMPFIIMDGKLPANEISDRIQSVLQDFFKFALTDGTTTVDPLFRNLDNNELIKYADGILSGIEEVDLRFIKKGIETVTIGGDDWNITFPMFAIFEVIYILEEVVELPDSDRVRFERTAEMVQKHYRYYKSGEPNLPTTCRKESDVLVNLILTPKKKDGTCPTLMASDGLRSGSIKNMVSTGYYPKPGVLEVWEAQEKVVSGSNSVRRLRATHYSDKLEHLLKPLPAAENTKQLSPKMRKISNSSIPEIDDAITNGKDNQYIRIRHLTPRDRLKLMGVDDKPIEIMLNSGVTDDDLCHQAGNSIVVDVLYHIFRKMFIDRDTKERDDDPGPIRIGTHKLSS